MKLTQTQAQRALVPLLAFAMSGLMSLFMTAFNLGPSLSALAALPQQWVIAFAVALPSALFVVPLIRNGLARVTVPSLSMESPSSPNGPEAVTRASVHPADIKLSARAG